MKNIIIPVVLFALSTGCITTREANPCHPAGDPEKCADWLDFQQREDDKESREQLAQRACVRGSDKACLLMERPSKVVLERLCDANNGEACFRLADGYFRRGEELRFLKRACELNEARACSKLTKGSESPEKERLAARACEFGLDEECDSKTPPKVLESNCLKGSGHNCAVLGALLLGQGKALEAKPLFEKACRTIDQDIVCRMPEIHAACVAGDIIACESLLDIGDPTGDGRKHFEAGLTSHLKKLDPASEEALFWVSRACDRGIEQYCRQSSSEEQ